MRFLTHSWITLAIVLCASSATYAGTDARTRDLLRQIDDLWRGDSSHGIMRMEVKTAHYARQMTMEAWSKGTEQTLVRILSPVKEKGTATLKSGTNIYSYLPKTDRTIRLTSGMMGGSWMGSHFTNDDLVRESRREDEYDAAISFEGRRGEQDVIEFTLVPKSDAAVVWGKVVLTIRSTDHIPLSEIYYDEDMALARSFSFSAVKNMANGPRPTVMQVTPADHSEEYTRVIYEQLELNVPINDELFSLTRLKQR